MGFPTVASLKILLALLFLAATVAAQAPANGSGPLSNILNPDGSIRPNMSGSFDSNGYRMSFGPNGEPRFAPAESQPIGPSCNDGWQDLGFTYSGTDSGVYAIVADGNGSVYVGGDFTAVYNVGARGIAKWNGTTWSTVGSGLGNGQIEGLAISGTDLYAAGVFESVGGVAARNIAKWNGTAWSAMGSGVGGQSTSWAHAVAVAGTTVYAGGDFGIARWDGTSWATLAGGVNGGVHALASSGNDVYVGGFFTAAGNLTVAGIAKWDGAAWSTLGTGLTRATGGSPQVEAIAVSGSDVYVGGTFTGAGGNPASNIAKWNGSAWSALGSGVTGGRVTALAVSGADVYAGGFFNAAGGNAASRIARWDGVQWNALGAGVSDIVQGIGVLGSTIVVGGFFTTVAGVPARGIAIWTGSSWNTFPGNSLNGNVVRGVAVSGTDVYVVGSFTTAGSLTVNNVAKWNGTSWSALGTGVPSGFLNAVAVSGNNVYIGGNFSNAGGVNANNIARWNGTNWSQLGSGVSNGSVAVITIVGEDVLVGGSFATAGGSAANKIAKWNGTSWSGFNSAIIGGAVVAIAPVGDILYVGATTTTIDSPNYFLKYEAGTWTGLGNGMTNGGVSSIAVSGNDIYVAGGFTSVGGVAGTYRIAKWNNGTWSAMGSGLPSGPVFSSQVAIAMSGNDVIAVGDFRTSTGGPGNYIARWNGSTWLPMGAGLSGPGWKLAVGGGDIYVGGEFTSAGCYVSPFFAQWHETSWTGAASTDWHTAANWGGGTVPPPNAGVTIAANNASIISADVTVSSLIITNNRTVGIAAGRTLTVTGNLDLVSGSITGPGTLIVNGSVQMNGDILGLASLTVNGGLTLNSGRIEGGPVNLTLCTPGALGGGSSTFFITSLLTRCVNSSGTFRFPVGTGTVYAPIELSGIAGSGNFTVDARAGAYLDPVTGLPSDRLQRWWNTSATGITQANLVFNYVDSEVVGLESRYRAYRISGGAATQLPTTLNQTTNRATVNGVTSFAAFTLAEGTPVPLTLSGRVTGASGRGAWNVIVSLDDGQGNVRYTVVNPFGYYRFPNVLTYRAYTVRVMSRKYNFAVPQRTIEFDEFTTSVNFSSTDH